jgi:hypothetical protein
MTAYSTQKGNESFNKILVWKPEGKRPLGKRNRRCEDNIKMMLAETGCDLSWNWIGITLTGGILWIMSWPLWRHNERGEVFYQKLWYIRKCQVVGRVFYDLTAPSGRLRDRPLELCKASGGRSRDKMGHKYSKTFQALNSTFICT